MTSTVTQVINDLHSTSSRTEKENILLTNKDNALLKKTFELVLNPYVNFFITSVPQELPPSILEEELNSELEITEDIVIGYLYQQAFGSVDRKELKEGVAAFNFLCKDEDVRSLLDSIIKKDLGCGVGASTVNKVWDSLIPTYKLMKAEEKAHLKGIKYPAFVDEKIDGVRMTAYVTPAGEVELKSSSGKTYQALDNIKSQVGDYYSKIKESYYDGCIIDGELIAIKDGEFIGRAKSNGLALKALLGTATQQEEDMLEFVCFDLLGSAMQIEQGFDSSTLVTRRQSFIKLESYSHIYPVKSRFVEDEASAIKFFDRIVSAGGEGVVVKSHDSPYEAKRSKHWVKLKKEYEADVIITDAKPHSKKNGMIGSLTVESSDGKVIGSVGTKMSDALRKELYTLSSTGTLLGRIATIQFMELTDKKGKRSFYLPRFIELRDDKEEADDLAKIEDMV